MTPSPSLSPLPPPLLRFEGVCKRFGGTQAVDDVTLEVRAGEVLALLGENGAGKSTLIKLLAGIHKADTGHMLFDGQPESVWRSRDPLRQPVAFIHQDLGLVEWMTVAENVALGMGYPRWFGWKHGLVDWRAADRVARRVLDRVGCDIDPGRRVFSLTRAEKSLLAIGRALEVRARLTPHIWQALREGVVSNRGDGLPEETIFVGLTSILWREAWKYGDRAFRYCQHDVGHALGAFLFDGADAAGLDEELIGDRRRAQHAPGGAVVGGLEQE